MGHDLDEVLAEADALLADETLVRSASLPRGVPNSSLEWRTSGVRIPLQQEASGSAQRKPCADCGFQSQAESSESSRTALS